MSVPSVPAPAPAGAPAASGCPRRRTLAPLAPGGVRPSDMLMAFFALAVVFLVAAAVFAVLSTALDDLRLRWVALHLALLGGVSQLVLGAAQFFAGAFLATAAPSRRLLVAQLVGWNAGVVLVVVGVPTDRDALAGAGGLLVVLVMLLFIASLRTMRRVSLQTAPWATRWYTAGALFLVAGGSMGPVMATGHHDWVPGSLLAGHLVLVIGGWFGTAIVGTLQTFHPSLTGTRLRHPRLQAPAFGAWIAGIALGALGALLDVDAVALAGWGLLAAAAGMVAVNVVASERKAVQRSFGGILVAAAQVFLVAGAIAGLVMTAQHGPATALLGPDRDVLVALLVTGWVALTVVGSLDHLLRLMSRVRGGFRLAGPAGLTTTDTAAAVALPAAVAATAVVAVTGGPAGPVRVVLAVCAAGVAARLVTVAVRAVRAAPLRL